MDRATLRKAGLSLLIDGLAVDLIAVLVFQRFGGSSYEHSAELSKLSQDIPV